MDWNQGYTATFRLFKVNKETWDNGEEVPSLMSASISMDTSSDLVESASITIDDNPVNGYVRLIMEAKNSTGLDRVELGTVLVVSPKRSINVNLNSYDLECYSVLKPASDKLLPIGWFFPEGGDPIAGACELLQKSLQCPVTLSTSDKTTEDMIVAENNETYLSMAVYLLKDTDWFIYINGHGEVTVEQKKDTVVTTFDLVDNDILMPDMTDETDLYDVPNILRITDGQGNYETVRNEDENSTTSIDGIGWEKWKAESVTLESDETLLGKARERFEELSKSTRKISYKREYDPSIRINDNIKCMLPQQDIIGIFRITSQSLEIENGITVSETAEFETMNWRG